MEWFKQHVLIVMEWPPNSLDMNPIEHLWQTLKSKFHWRFPDIYCIRGGSEMVREILEERLHLVWQDICAEELEKLIMSMPERLDCIRCEDGIHLMKLSLDNVVMYNFFKLEGSSIVWRWEIMGFVHVVQSWLLKTFGRCLYLTRVISQKTRTLHWARHPYFSKILDARRRILTQEGLR